jgi:hypothetical protein
VPNKESTRPFHRQLMTDSRMIDDDMLWDVVIAAGGDWLRVTTWLASHPHSGPHPLTAHIVKMDKNMAFKGGYRRRSVLLLIADSAAFTYT